MRGDYLTDGVLYYAGVRERRRGYALRFSREKNAVAVVTIDRPEALNALNSEVLEALERAVDAVLSDESVRVIIFTGAGRAFVAGADIGEMADLGMEEGRAFGRRGQILFRKIERAEKPTIAAVNGFALGGGCELAMACDMRIASEYAVFGQPEVGLGITPGFSGTQRLTAIVGKAKAAEIILSAANIDAVTAEKLGLVNRMVPAYKLMEEAEALAVKIASNAPLAVKWANSAIRERAGDRHRHGYLHRGGYCSVCALPRRIRRKE